MSVMTILLITLLNATICIALPRLLTLNWSSFFANLLDSETATVSVPTESLSLRETPSQS